MSGESSKESTKQPESKIIMPSSQQLRKQVKKEAKRDPDLTGPLGYPELVLEQKVLRGLVEEAIESFNNLSTDIVRVEEKVSEIRHHLKCFGFPIR